MTQTALTFGPHSGDGPATEGVGHVILPEEMIANSQAASSFLKAVAHESRLMILCHLTTGEKSVTELENLLSSRQAAVSQQLARLRLEGLVEHRREGKVIYYCIKDHKVRRLVDLIYEIFCDPIKD
ncbi:ArsR family transcriptional regulator [Brevirhabdus pacifica]|nr:ArsR family transcriptional regulator [Brevirhabdus pacifica]